METWKKTTPTPAEGPAAGVTVTHPTPTSRLSFEVSPSQLSGRAHSHYMLNYEMPMESSQKLSALGFLLGSAALHALAIKVFGIRRVPSASALVVFLAAVPRRSGPSAQSPAAELPRYGPEPARG